MTRDEFKAIVNQIGREEEDRIREQVKEMLRNPQSDDTARLLTEALLNSAFVSARVTARIIEQCGLMDFDE